MGNIKLIAADMDNTLMMKSTAETLSNVSAMERAKEAGAILVPCTARPWYGAQSYFKLFPFDDYAITLNGAGLVHTHTGEIYRQENLSPKGVCDALAVLFSMEGIEGVRVNTTGGYAQWNPRIGEAMIEEKGPSLFGAWPFTNISYRDRDAFVDAIKEDTQRILLFVKQTSMALHKEIEDAIGHLLEMEMHITDSYLIEITAPGCDKGKTLLDLCSRLGIAQSEVMAIGDNMNDMSMIAWAGVGVAVDNAQPALKEMADVVAPPYEAGGIYAVIEEYLFGNKGQYGAPARVF
ncbi:Cof-type HAD-IIB family hydrolase [Eubacteriales bacterium OttesenSCG-928-M02]|nr:Cof-type HAD-IIB family hydrolase [Eubacteriales bacterium OttesenSCG-928-M02]